MLAKLKSLLQYEPAVLAWALNGGVASILAFLVHLTPTQLAAATTITTAVAAVVTAIQARPVAVSVLTGAVATIATAASAFGLHLPSTVIGVIVAGLSTVLGLVFRQNLTPAVRLAQQPGTVTITMPTPALAGTMVAPGYQWVSTPGVSATSNPAGSTATNTSTLHQE